MNYEKAVFDFHYKNRIPYWMELKPAKGKTRWMLKFFRLSVGLLNKICLRWSKSTVRAYKRDVLFRLHLILDETEEIIASLIDGDLDNLADSTTDLLYVTIGMQVTYFLPTEETFKEVHRSNMTKDFKTEDRRLYKGKNWSPPDMNTAIATGQLRMIKEYKDACDRRARLRGQDDLG